MEQPDDTPWPPIENKYLRRLTGWSILIVMLFFCAFFPMIIIPIMEGLAGIITWSLGWFEWGVDLAFAVVTGLFNILC